MTHKQLVNFITYGSLILVAAVFWIAYFIYTKVPTIDKSLCPDTFIIDEYVSDSSIDKPIRCFNSSSKGDKYTLLFPKHLSSSRVPGNYLKLEDSVSAAVHRGVNITIIIYEQEDLESMRGV